MPPCVLKKEQRKHLQLPSQSTLAFSKNKRITISKEVSLICVKKPECSECIFNEKCPGIWHEYAEHYGLEEFKPIKENIT